MKIIFFTESLVCGGKERRLIELLQYLKSNTDYEMVLVITEPMVHYDYVFDMGIPILIFKRRIKYDPLPFLRFLKYCRRFKPDIIHAWGRMTTFYSIPTKLILGNPIITNMIADAQRIYKKISIKNLFFTLDVIFSDLVIANSRAGLIAHEVNSPKALVIKNGVRLERFNRDIDSIKIKNELGVTTNYIIIMVAAFSLQKDYDFFLDLAKEICKTRNDVTFVAVGDGPEWKRINERISKENIQNVVLTGAKKDVESIIAASDIGILCTYSEGISNAIIEYMAMGKPVISTDIIGGSKEIIEEGETGFCVEKDLKKVTSLINLLLDDKTLRDLMGKKAKETIFSQFSIERMGKEYLTLYQKLLNRE